jgi:hypothetical protein
MKFPTPYQDDIVTWIHEANEKITETRKTFLLIGFRCKEFEEADSHIVECNIDKE